MFIIFATVEVLLFFLIIALFKLSGQYFSNKNEVARPSLFYDKETRQVILDGKFVIASFRSMSFNRSLFEYLYNNPGRSIHITELEREVLKGRTVNLAKVADAMGFRYDLRRILFTYDGDSITFHPDRLTRYGGVLKIT